MKWIGQQTYDQVSRFKNDIFIVRSTADATLELSSWSATATHSGTLKFLKSGNDVPYVISTGAHTTAGETLGRIEAFGVTDGDAAVLSSYIEFANDAVSDADSVPGKIIFATSDADDAGTPTARLTINDDGHAVFSGAIYANGGINFDSVNLSTLQTSAELLAMVVSEA